MNDLATSQLVLRKQRKGTPGERNEEVSYGKKSQGSVF